MLTLLPPLKHGAKYPPHRPAVRFLIIPFLKSHSVATRSVLALTEESALVDGWFTEGFDTRDLKEAKALPEELAA